MRCNHELVFIAYIEVEEVEGPIKRLDRLASFFPSNRTYEMIKEHENLPGMSHNYETGFYMIKSLVIG